MEVPSSSIVLANTEVKNVLEESDGKWGCCVKLSRHNFTILIWTWYPCTSLQHKTCLPSWLHTLLKQPCTRGFVTFKPHGDPNRYACFRHFVEPRNENRAHWALASDMQFVEIRHCSEDVSSYSMFSKYSALSCKMMTSFSNLIFQ